MCDIPLNIHQPSPLDLGPIPLPQAPAAASSPDPRCTPGGSAPSPRCSRRWSLEALTAARDSPTILDFKWHDSGWYWMIVVSCANSFGDGWWWLVMVGGFNPARMETRLDYDQRDWIPILIFSRRGSRAQRGWNIACATHYQSGSVFLNYCLI